jgi:hypothetical protein
MSEFSTRAFTGLRPFLPPGVDAFLFKMNYVRIGPDDSREIDPKCEWYSFSTDPGRLDFLVMNLPNNALQDVSGFGSCTTSDTRTADQFEGRYRLGWSQYGALSTQVLLNPTGATRSSGGSSGRVVTARPGPRATPQDWSRAPKTATTIALSSLNMIALWINFADVEFNSQSGYVWRLAIPVILPRVRIPSP